MAIQKYRCWKCRRDYSIEQPARAKELLVFCPNCHNLGREIKLFRIQETHGLVTDSTFMAGSHVDDGFGTDKFGRRYAMALARKAGVSVSGKRYCHQLARFKGDPRAWVDGRGYVKDVCIANGFGCEGAVSVALPQDDRPDPLEGPYEVSDKVVDRHLALKLAKAGEPVPQREVADMRDSLKQQLSGKG